MYGLMAKSSISRLNILRLLIRYLNLVQLAEIFIMKRKKIGNIDFSTCIMHIFQGHNEVNKACVLLLKHGYYIMWGNQEIILAY